MSASRRVCVVAVWSVTSLACATTSPLTRQLCYDPEMQLANVLRPLEDLRANGCQIEDSTVGPVECDRLHQELQRLDARVLYGQLALGRGLSLCGRLGVSGRRGGRWFRYGCRYGPGQ